MPSLSFTSNKGRPIAFIRVDKIKHPELNELNNTIIYLNDDDDGVSSLEVQNVEIYPMLKYKEGEVQNHRIAVLGKSGSGKSHFIGQLLDSMTSKKFGNPERKIVIISGVEQDDALDKERGPKDQKSLPIRLNLDNERLGEVTIDDLDGSIVIFDDTENISDKVVNTTLHRLRNSICERGRHHNIDLLSVSHNALGGHMTRLVHSESTGCVVFPQYTQFHTLNAYLTKYIGLSKENISKVVQLGKVSRYVYISNLSPCYIVYMKGVFLIN